MLKRRSSKLHLLLPSQLLLLSLSTHASLLLLPLLQHTRPGAASKVAPVAAAAAAAAPPRTHCSDRHCLSRALPQLLLPLPC
jgi:hypothetical protein